MHFKQRESANLSLRTSIDSALLRKTEFSAVASAFYLGKPMYNTVNRCINMPP